MLLIIERDDRDVQLQLRQEEESGSSSSGDESDSDDEVPFTRSTTGLTVLIFGLLVAGLSILLAWFVWRRQFRIQGSRRSRKPELIVKLQQFWCKWIPGANTKGNYSCNLGQQDQAHTWYNGGSTMESEMQAHPTTTDPAVGIARSTSERSVLTLPAYTSSARPTERIVGREGERAGVDVVLEYPVTAEEVESRRQEEMASLYNIRLARQAEREAREEHAEERQRRSQPYRQSGSSMLDVTTPSQTQIRNSTGNESTSSETLLANHQAALLNRERRTSSVAYSCVGVAHHDGTRIHNTNGDAGSTIAGDADADGRSTADMPLLGSAASMGGAGGRHSRRISDISMVSMISRGSAAGSANPIPGITTPGSTQRSDSGVRTSSNGSTSANGAATIFTPSALSDDSLEDGHVVVTTPPEDHTSIPPPRYNISPPNYEDPTPTAQPSTTQTTTRSTS